MSIRFNGNAANFLRRLSSDSGGLFNYNGPYTMMVWLKIVNDTNTLATFFNVAEVGSVNFDIGQFGPDGTSTLIAARVNGGGADGNGSNNSLGVWKHYVMVRRSATLLELYEDTVFKANVTTNVTGRVGVNTLDIGRTNLNNFTGEPFDGEAAYLRIWTTDLTAAEISAEFSSTTVVKTANLYGSYPMATSATAGNDVSGQNRPFTVNGTITTGASSPAVGLPVANAGFNQTRVVNELIYLDASQSKDIGGGSITYSWQQISGTSVSLNNSNSAFPSFTAPAAATTLVFRVTVQDIESNTNQADVNVSIVAANSNTWLWKTPKEVGMNPDTFYSSLTALLSPVMVIKDGRVIATKGNVSQTGYVWSASKSLVALIFSRQLQLGNIAYSTNITGSDNPTSPLATAQQFLNMTSDFGLTPHNPGDHYSYNNGAYHHFGTYLKTNFYSGQDHVQTIQNAFVNSLNFEDTLGYNTAGFMSGWDGGWSMSTRDLARICQLVLNNGNWNNAQILSSSFISELYSSKIPNTATLTPDTANAGLFYNETPYSARLANAYSYGFWLSHVNDVYAQTTINEAIQIAGAFGTTAYISRKKNLIVVASNVGGTGINNDTVHISATMFDAIADSVLNTESQLIPVSRWAIGSTKRMNDNRRNIRTYRVTTVSVGPTIVSGLTGR